MISTIKPLLWVCIVLTAVTACSKSEPGIVGTSSSCDKPPKQLELSGKTYQLKPENAKGDAVMKLAYLTCEKGKFTLGDAEDPYTVQYAGNPSKNKGDIVLLGDWGGTGSWSQALYSLEDKSLSTNK